MCVLSHTDCACDTMVSCICERDYDQTRLNCCTTENCLSATSLKRVLCILL